MDAKSQLVSIFHKTWGWGVVYPIDHEVAQGPINFCDWMLNLSWDHFGVHQGENVRVNMEFKVTNKTYFEAYVIPWHGPMADWVECFFWDLACQHGRSRLNGLKFCVTLMISIWKISSLVFSQIHFLGFHPLGQSLGFIWQHSRWGYCKHRK